VLLVWSSERLAVLRGNYLRAGAGRRRGFGRAPEAGAGAGAGGCRRLAEKGVPSAVRKTVVSEGSNEKVGRMSRTYLGSRWPSSGRSAITRRRPSEGHMRPLALSYGPLDRLDASVAADAGGLRGLV